MEDARSTSGNSPFCRHLRAIAIFFNVSYASSSIVISYRFSNKSKYEFFKFRISATASSSTCRISSLMEPMSASRSPIFWSSNFGHKMPGVSNSSRFLLSRIHCFPFVTPGLFPVLAHAFPAKELINVDLPTFGIPTTMARTGRLMMPRFLSRSIFSLQDSCTSAWMFLIPAPVFALSCCTK